MKDIEQVRVLHGIITDAGYEASVYIEDDVATPTAKFPEGKLNDFIADLVEATQGDLERLDELSDAIRSMVVMQTKDNSPKWTFVRFEAFNDKSA